MFLILLLLTVWVNNINAQSVTNYTFSASSGTYTALVGGISPALTSGTVDEGWYNGIPIGFTYTYMGTAYTTMSACTNGWMTLGGNITGAAYTNALATGGNRPVIAPLWDDLQITSFTYLTQGAPGVRTFTAQWSSALWTYTGTSAAISFQVILSEATGQVKFVYHQETGALASASASIGITAAGTGSGNYLSLNGAGTSPTVSSTTETATIAAKPAEGQTYTFTPFSSTPSDPANMTFTSVGVTGMTVNWVDNSTNESFFVVKRATDAGFTANVVTTIVASTTIAGIGTAYNLPVTGLFPSTTYYFKISAGNEGQPVSAGITGNQATGPAGNITSNGTGGGLWGSTSTWSGGVLPTNGDNVTILNGDAVTINTAAVALSVTVGQGVSGTLQFESATARTLTVSIDVTISANATFSTASTGTVTTHVLSVGGNLTNNGILDFSTNSNTAGAGITFAGPNNITFSGTGATTDLFLLTMSKSSISVLVEMNLANFSVKGLSAAAAGALLTSGAGTGTLKISGTNTFNGNLWSTASYTIPATLGFWLNNPNFTVNAQTASSPTLAGLFRISNGIYNIGTATGNSMGFSTGSVIIVEGGAINVTGRFGVAAAANSITYTQTGGTITVCTIGNTSTSLGSFDLGTSTASSIIMNGGTIIVQIASTAASGPRDYRDQAGTGVVTGGTLQLGNASSGAAKSFNIWGVIPNLVLTNTSGNHTATLNISTTGANYYNSVLNVTTNTGNTINFGNSYIFFNGNTITNNGIITHTGASSIFYVSSPSNVYYTGTGTVTAPMTLLGLDNEANFTINPASPNIPVGYIVLWGGNFVNANKLTLGNGGSTIGRIQVGNTTTPSLGGTFDAAPTFNLGTGGEIVSYLRTTNPIVIGPEVNPARVLYSMTVDPDAGNTVTLSGGDLQVTTTLTLTSGFMNLGGNILTLGTNVPAAGTLTSTGTLYNGKFKRWITAATGNSDFPLGTTTIVGEIKRSSTNTTDLVVNSTDKVLYNKLSGVRIRHNTLKDAPERLLTSLFAGETKNEINTPDNNLTNPPVRILASINFTTAPTAAGTLTAEWVNSPGGTNGLPLFEGLITVDKTSDNGFWRVTAGDGLTGGLYTGTFTGTSISGISDYTRLVLVKRTNSSSPWLLNGTHVTTTGSNSVPVLSRTGMSGFSEFAVGASFNENPLPVELSSFTSNVNGRDVSLSWTTKTEKNSDKFVIERSILNGNLNQIWTNIGSVKASVLSNSPKQYSYIDKNLQAGKYQYRLKMIDNDGSFQYSKIVETEISIPKNFDLSQNYPNPFNPSTKIKYNLPFDARVNLEIYNVTGEKIGQLVNQDQSAGYYNVEFNSSSVNKNISSGIYLYKITIIDKATGNNFTAIKKMILLK